MKICCCNGYLNGNSIMCNIGNTACHVPELLKYKGMFYSWKDCPYCGMK